MGGLLRLALLVVLVPVVYVASAIVYFPAVVWHRWFPPAASELMEIRARAARVDGEGLELRYDWVPLEDISSHLVHGVLAAEDTRFYEHHGFDFEQIRISWELNRRGGGRAMRGASTITQQTAKNLYLSPSRNVLRKAREALLTAWMELVMPKDRIMELYLNIVELGPGVFGAEAASREYFGRSAAGISRDQAALLAATLPAPLLRNPGEPTPYLRRRQRMIASRMGRWYEGPSLAQEEAEQVLEETAEPEEVESEALDVSGADSAAVAAPADSFAPPEGELPLDFAPEAAPEPAPPAAAPGDTAGAP